MSGQMTGKAKNDALRIAEAALFAAETPLSAADLAGFLPGGVKVEEVLPQLAKLYAGRGVELAKVGGKYMFRTAADLRFILRREQEKPRRLSRGALETLAIIAYHQPVTRAEIQEIRGVQFFSKGLMDALLGTGWIKICGRKTSPGRPVTYGVSDAFLTHFGLESARDLPGLNEMKEAGLLDDSPPKNPAENPKDDTPEDTPEDSAA